jgi:hypothetical protein
LQETLLSRFGDCEIPQLLRSFVLKHCWSQRSRQECRAQSRELELDLPTAGVNDRITVLWPGITFGRLRCDSAFHASQCKIPDDVELAVPCPQNARGLEGQQSLISRIRNVAGRQGTISTKCVTPVLSATAFGNLLLVCSTGGTWKHKPALGSTIKTNFSCFTSTWAGSPNAA